MKTICVVSLLLIAPQAALARPYQIASIGPTAVRVVDLESIRVRSEGKPTALISSIGRQGRSILDARPTVQQTLVEFDCSSRAWRPLSDILLAPDLSRLNYGTAAGDWQPPGGDEDDVVAVVCTLERDSKLTLEAPSLAALVEAINRAIK